MKRQQSGSKPEKRATLKEMLANFDKLRFGVLATSDHGRPYTSLIAFALTLDHRTLIFATPRATSKYRNISNQSAVSILLDDCLQQAADLGSAQAVTLLGTAKEVTAAQKARYRSVFVSKHPELALFIDEPDTALIAVNIQQAVRVKRFQDVSRWP
jgi:heme iron utilization protein